MMLVLSGEGPTDLGSCRTPVGNCCAGDFNAGPLAIVVDKLLEPSLGYRPMQLQPMNVHFIHKTSVGQRARDRARRHGFAFVGKKRGQETGDFFISAWMLGEMALELEVEHQDIGIAVLHRDSDERAEGPRDQWDRKLRSMRDGFARGAYVRGVPMLPKPISESWLLCLARQGLASCAALENESASEKSPRSLKRQLDSELGEHHGADALAEWIEDAFDADKLSEMPSFAAFREALDGAVASVLAKAQL